MEITALATAINRAEKDEAKQQADAKKDDDQKDESGK